MTVSTLLRPAHAPLETAAVPRALIVAALGLGAYLSALDISIVNAILPIVASSFGADLAAIEWVVTTYLLVQSVLMLTVGRLGDMWGHRHVYLVGLVIFVLASIGCAAAPSIPWLVLARAVQGIGASMVFTNVAAILTEVFPAEQRGRAMGILATIVYVGLATGAPLGGFLSGAFGWPSVFLLNIPLGLLALIFGWRLAPADAPSGRRDGFDLAGATVYIPGVALLLLGLNQGHAWGWTSMLTLASLVLGAVIVAAWVLIELRVPNPTIDLRLFQQRAFGAPVVSALFNYIAVSSTFVLPFAFIQGHGLTPAQAGLLLMCQPVAMAVTASVSGALSDRIGTRAPATVGMLVVALGLLLLSRQDTATPMVFLALALLVTGVGIGLFTSPNSSAVLGAVPPQRRGVANGVLGTARTLGMLLGVAIAGAVYATILGSHGSEAGAAATLSAASAGLVVASGVAFIGAITSSIGASTNTQPAAHA